MVLKKVFFQLINEKLFDTFIFKHKRMVLKGIIIGVICNVTVLFYLDFPLNELHLEL